MSATSAFNLKMCHNQYIPPENIRSQQYIDSINSLTKEQKLIINTKEKTRPCYITTLISTSLEQDKIMNDDILETLTETKLLGTNKTSDLNWDENANRITKKSYVKWYSW